MDAKGEYCKSCSMVNMIPTLTTALTESSERERVITDIFMELADEFVKRTNDESVVDDLVNYIDAKCEVLKICTWCKESGLKPSEYIKRVVEFELNAYDENLGGLICDECYREELDFEEELKGEEEDDIQGTIGEDAEGE